ncbi:MAG TPA: hypothetical protein VGL46_18630 [Pseudonocardiaceae bacterium]|jgi:hypothetical protein
MATRSTTERPSTQHAYLANALVEPVIDDVRCPVPAFAVSSGWVTVWPAVSVRLGSGTFPASMTVDLTTWFVTCASDRDTTGVTLPVVCCGQGVAIALAEAFSEHNKQGYADVADAQGLAEWCTWWASEHPGVDVRRSTVPIK